MEFFLRGWQAFWADLNPIPEPVRIILASPWFWLVVWLGACASVGRSVLGARLGPWLGFGFAGLIWAWLLPDGAQAVTVVIVALLAVRAVGGWLPRTRLGHRARGVKVCPECAEEVRAQANVCRYCQHRF
jgi:hypothetical protein